ncbi:MAG: oxidoreductase [Theionarchaea archaeon]|nr:oxidoreductase [Theionarchaea archaeon]MBU6999902.1 oxidoreductase [Theionarchaea archaeon]MBU7020092.1 oxidoreductase [Theionarchaea archaeon]MBU7034309.1 oxidoreductase [Theionarchaea archaeon]MBU7039492.1 oxidoreductase [Theionarchaea archaeon]
MDKLKFAFYWAASCGGCEIAVLDIDEKILDVVEKADIVFWPVALDIKYKDVEAFQDKYIDVCFFNGAIRTSEHEEMAHLLRAKSKTLVAFGACACFGGIPGLANVSDRDEIFNLVYKELPSVSNPDETTPQETYSAPEGELTLPQFFDTVKALHQVCDVDYFLPGCPPTPELIEQALTAIFEGTLPPKGSTLAPEKALCEECPLEIQEKKIPFIKRPYQVIPDGKRCLLEQGIVCMGINTRAGCGARCIKANMPCRGCMGPTPEVTDQGAKLVSAIASILGVEGEERMTEKEVEALIDQIKDPLGTFYRYTLPISLLRRKVMKK